VAALLPPGNAGSHTAADHIETAQLALAQPPKHLRREHQTPTRTDSAGGTHTFLDWLSRPGRWLSYSVGMTITDTLHQAVLKIPKKAWTPAYDAGATERPGAWAAETTDMPDLSTRPEGMRLILRKERPHPGAHCASPTSTDYVGTTPRPVPSAIFRFRHVFALPAGSADSLRLAPPQPYPSGLGRFGLNPSGNH
jgi:hypothetical protein